MCICNWKHWYQQDLEITKAQEKKIISTLHKYFILGSNHPSSCGPSLDEKSPTFNSQVLKTPHLNKALHMRYNQHRLEKQNHHPWPVSCCHLHPSSVIPLWTLSHWPLFLLWKKFLRMLCGNVHYNGLYFCNLILCLLIEWEIF